MNESKVRFADSPRRPLGRTGLRVAPIGLGAGPLGDLALDEARAERAIDAALDLGVDVIDTAPSYGASEERIGRALRGRRERVLLVTKGGYGVAGVEDWTPLCIARGIDRALERLATDRLDVFLLHSCDRARLARGNLFEPLLAAKRAGKVRAIGYSGDGDALAWAVHEAPIDVVECSVNVVDQEALALLGLAAERGLGVLAKRPLANGAAQLRERPTRPDVATYWDRMQSLDAPPTAETMVRFAAHAPGVSCALVGTTNPEHLRDAVRFALAGPPSDAGALRAHYARHRWPGVI